MKVSSTEKKHNVSIKWLLYCTWERSVIFLQTDNYYNHPYTYQQKELFRIKSVTLCWSWAYSPKYTIFGLHRAFYILQPYHISSEDKVTELDNSDFMTPPLKNLHNCVMNTMKVIGSSQSSANYPFSTGNNYFFVRIYEVNALVNKNLF